MLLSTLCSIPDGVIGIFHRHNPSGRNLALGLIQPLTEMSKCKDKGHPATDRGGPRNSG